jgi:hypothetical protein
MQVYVYMQRKYPHTRTTWLGFSNQPNFVMRARSDTSPPRTNSSNAGPLFARNVITCATERAEIAHVQSTLIALPPSGERNVSSRERREEEEEEEPASARALNKQTPVIMDLRIGACRRAAAR